MEKDETIFRTFPPNISEEEALVKIVDLQKMGRSHPFLPIAPDGYIPNSVIRKFYHEVVGDVVEPPKDLKAWALARRLKVKEDVETRLKKKTEAADTVATHSCELDDRLPTVRGGLDTTSANWKRTARNEGLDGTRASTLDQFYADMDSIYQTNATKGKTKPGKKRRLTKASLKQEKENKLRQKKEDEERAKAAAEEEELGALLLRQIMARPWFTIVDCPVTVPAVSQALITLMDMMKDAAPHRQMGRSLVSILRELGIEEDLCQDIRAALREQLDRLVGDELPTALENDKVSGEKKGEDKTEAAEAFRRGMTLLETLTAFGEEVHFLRKELLTFFPLAFPSKGLEFDPDTLDQLSESELSSVVGCDDFSKSEDEVCPRYTRSASPKKSAITAPPPISSLPTQRRKKNTGAIPKSSQKSNISRESTLSVSDKVTTNQKISDDDKAVPEKRQGDLPSLPAAQEATETKEKKSELLPISCPSEKEKFEKVLNYTKPDEEQRTLLDKDKELKEHRRQSVEEGDSILEDDAGYEKEDDKGIQLVGTAGVSIVAGAQDPMLLEDDSSISGDSQDQRKKTKSGLLPSDSGLGTEGTTVDMLGESARSLQYINQPRDGPSIPPELREGVIYLSDREESNKMDDGERKTSDNTSGGTARSLDVEDGSSGTVKQLDASLSHISHLPKTEVSAQLRSMLDEFGDLAQSLTTPKGNKAEPGGSQTAVIDLPQIVEGRDKDGKMEELKQRSPPNTSQHGSPQGSATTRASPEQDKTTTLPSNVVRWSTPPVISRPPTAVSLPAVSSSQQRNTSDAPRPITAGFHDNRQHGDQSSARQWSPSLAQDHPNLAKMLRALPRIQDSYEPSNNVVRTLPEYIRSETDLEGYSGAAGSPQPTSLSAVAKVSDKSSGNKSAGGHHSGLASAGVDSARRGREFLSGYEDRLFRSRTDLALPYLDLPEEAADKTPQHGHRAHHGSNLSKSFVLTRPNNISPHDWGRISGGRDGIMSRSRSKSMPFSHCVHEDLCRRGFHKHGLSIGRHLQRYELVEVVSLLPSTQDV